MKKAIWISYDLGIGGDYDGLYRWLANHGAVECGDGLAFFNYQAKSSDNILEELKAEIEAGVESTIRRGYIVFGRRRGKLKVVSSLAREKATLGKDMEMLIKG